MIDTSANLVISKSNEVFLKINTEPHIEYELRDHFKFEVPNAKFMPQYRGRNWNGEIHLYDMRSKQIYVGLLDKIVNFCEQYGYSYSLKIINSMALHMRRMSTSHMKVSRIICIPFVPILPGSIKWREYTVP